jgi:hypothetical protein
VRGRGAAGTHIAKVSSRGRHALPECALLPDKLEEGTMVNTGDETLTRRIRDIVAVATEDIDGVRVEVEDGVAYLEGVVSSAREANAISRAVRRLPGLYHVVTCLSTEKVRSTLAEPIVVSTLPTPVLMHYYSLS